MAFRIDESVLRGEIDNRIKGLVTGRIWVSGREHPLILNLKGNAHPDLAGCLLEFENSEPATPHPVTESLCSDQTGVAGDLTASRKCRVFDIPAMEAYDMCKRGEKPPEHLANVLYLEWFSQRNGRMVIESTTFRLKISSSLWTLTPEEESQRAQEAASAFNDFLKPFTRIIERSRNKDKGDLEKWDEFDHEKAMRDSDALTDKYSELIEKYGFSEEAEKIIAHEMGWTRLEEALEAEEHDEVLDSIDQKNWYELYEGEDPVPDPAAEGVDWVRDEDGEIHHPLAARAYQNSLKALEKLRDPEEPDLQDFCFNVQMIGAKLAGSLNHVWMDQGLTMPAFTVAALKRVLPLVHKAQESFLELKSRQLLVSDEILFWEKELAEVREEILRLMDDFRKRSDV